jgi:hypothetical protein
MATVYYKGLTGVRDSVTGITLATTTIDQLLTAIAADEGLPADYYKISLDGNPTVNDIVYGDSSTKLDTIGFTDGCTVICTTKQVGSKEERQIQKLEIAQLKRSGSAGDGSSVDIPGYRILNTYNRDLLPTKYTGNTVTNNDNTGGLYPGRPWITEASNPITSLRSFLSGAGQTAYDAASADSFFAVSSTDYNAVVAGVASVSTLGPDDASFTGTAGNAFSANYIVTYPQAYATVPASNYIIGFRAVTGVTSSQWRIYGGPTFKSTSPVYSQISTDSPSTGASTGTFYYLRKAPATQAATTYIGVLGTKTLTTTANSGTWTGGGYTTGAFTSWVSHTTNMTKVQVIITPTAVV